MSTPNVDSPGVSKWVGAESGQKVVEKIDKNRRAVTSGLKSAAGALHDKAGALPGGQKVTEATLATADAVGAAADYVRENDLKAMVADVHKLVKSHPGQTLLIAAAFGFLIARTLSRD